MDRHRLNAWVLLSVPGDRGTLGDLLVRADGINRATPDFEELRQSLAWLENAGYITRDGQQVAQTAAGEKLRKQCRPGNQSIFEYWDAVALELGKVQAEAEQGVPLSQEEYERACSDYSAMGAQMLHELYPDKAK